MITEKEICEYLEMLKQYGFAYKTDEVMQLVTDSEELMRYSSTHSRRLGIIYRSSYHIFVVDLVRGKNGELYTYERIIKTASGNSVVIVVQCQDRYVMLRQFRHAMGDYQLAFPRGFGESGISIEENTKKEISEELNAIAYDIMRIGTVVADSGLCGEEVNIVVCKADLPEIKYGYEGITDIVLVSMDEICEMIKAGRINDSFTLSAVSHILSQKLE